MLIALVLSFLQLISPADSTSIFEASKNQADSYIQNIEKGREIEENLWAITLLGSESDSIRIYIEQQSESSGSMKLFRDFEPDFQEQLQKVVFEIGSTELLIPLLLSYNDEEKKEEIYRQFRSEHSVTDSKFIDYEALIESVIHEKKLSTDILPNNRYYLPHFFILFSENYSTYLSNQYIDGITANWRVPEYSKSENKLAHTLASSSHFRALYITSKYSQTGKIYDQLSRHNYFPNSALKLKLYRYLDYSMFRIGLYDRSLFIVRNFSLPLAQYLQKNFQYLSTKQLQGVYLYSIGKVKAAEKIYKDVLSEINRQNLSISKSNIYNNLALAYHKLGKYDEYLDLQFQALKEAKISDNYEHQFQILNNLFVYYRDSNNPSHALNYLEKAQELALRKNKIEDLSRLNISLGSFYRKFKNDFHKAHEYYLKAEKQIDPENNTHRFTELLIEQAETYELQHKYSEALEKYDEITSIIESDNPSHLDAIINKALVRLKMENIQKAGDLIDRYKAYDLSILDFEQIIKAKTVEADYLQRKGQIAEALNILNPALKQVVVRAQSSGDLKTGFWQVEDEYLDAFELTVSILIKQNRHGEAVKKLDQLKTINNASLYQNPLVKSSLLNESELTQYKQLTSQLDATRKKLLAAPEDKQFALQQRISQLNAKKRKLDRKLSSKSEQQSLSIRRVQNQLSSRDLILHVTKLKDRYYIAQISRTGITMDQVSLDSTVRNQFTQAVQQVATNKTNLKNLYSITELLGMDQLPARIQNVTVIPDSYLYQLPIDILPIEKPGHTFSYGSAKYFIEKYQTQYLTSLNELTTEDDGRKRKTNSIDFAGYGISKFNGYNQQQLVPLPFAAKEVTTIAQKLTQFNNVETFINDESTKLTFNQTAPHAKILHMATHSSVSDRDPMFSTIYMNKSPASPDSTFEDRIFAYELFELNLNNEMIMLNSCESGSGSYIQGTGIMGISRALQYAGANSLVLNLWSVNDMMASEFAIHLYDQLNQGKSKAEALRATKQYFLQSKNASPHYWGPYMLIGNTEPIIHPNQDKNIAIAGLFTFYFLLMAGLSYFKNKGIIFSGN